MQDATKDLNLQNESLGIYIPCDFNQAVKTSETKTPKLSKKQHQALEKQQLRERCIAAEAKAARLEKDFAELRNGNSAVFKFPPLSELVALKVSPPIPRELNLNFVVGQVPEYPTFSSDPFARDAAPNLISLNPNSPTFAHTKLDFRDSNSGKDVSKRSANQLECDTANDQILKKFKKNDDGNAQ